MIKISAGEFAKIISGSLHDIDPQMIINQSPVINSKKQVQISSLWLLLDQKLMAMIM